MTDYQISNREWWVERWLELLDSYRFKKRLERARNYAREGNVLSIEFEEGQVLASVQGSEPEPYRVLLCMDRFSDEDWHYVIATLSEKAIFSAQLLAGQMPDHIEQVFIANGLSLFPYTLSDIHARCSCPDKANPCKHIGAVYYQLGDRFSEDPFVLFQLRGRTKDQILQALREVRSQSAPATPIPTAPVPVPGTVEPAAPVAETRSLQTFWRYQEPLDPALAAIAPPLDGKTVLDVLGSLPLPAEDGEAIKQYLKQVYHSVRQQILSGSEQNPWRG